LLGGKTDSKRRRRVSARESGGVGAADIAVGMTW